MRHMHMITRLGPKAAVAALILLGLAGCGTQAAEEQLNAGILPPVMNPITEINLSLRNLPPPERKVVVAVYNYADQTGQYKPSETTQTLSRAVTQGATSVLIKALQDVGDGSWFTVVEREKIDNLLKERRIITQMRMTYLGEKQIDPKALPPLLFAGVIFEGGIIGYDSNLQTGGIGARLLGIGADIKYRLDTITIYLRTVSTKNGQVLASVTTHKTIASIGVQGGVFKYIAIDKILEAEAGFTKNEPEQLAVQQAIEKAVYAMMIEGAGSNVWSFADKSSQERLLSEYRAQQPASTRLAGSEKPGKVAIAAPAQDAEAKAAKQNAAEPAAALAAKAAQRNSAGDTNSAPAATATPEKDQRQPVSAPGTAPVIPSWQTSVRSLSPISGVAPLAGKARSAASISPNKGPDLLPDTVKESFGHALSSH